jgi:homoserine O-acetyltransferase
MTSLFTHKLPLTLESGITLPGYHLAYTTHGRLNEKKNNTVWIFHALTANSDPAEWWPGLVGSGKLFDPADYFIVCVNIPGSCYGSSGPLDTNSSTGEPWYHNFPVFTTRDMIRAYLPLKKMLGIEKIHIGTGGSLGGQQLLEWAIEEPEAFENIIPIATNAYHSSWGVAFNASQRMCIEADASWKEKKPSAGMDGMKAARSVALLSYRNYETYLKKQTIISQHLFSAAGRETRGAESYQRYQGEKLARRFNAFSYYTLSQSMDTHNVGRGRDGVQKALKKIKAKTLIIGITTDVLFPLQEQQTLADCITASKFQTIHSPYGHDGFLLEYQKIEQVIREFLADKKPDAVFRKQASSFNLLL